jgi:tetratricopeptide (TPR) repeat protein/tRNA A-37 threonylcarbamoyl transferase component Bud32
MTFARNPEDQELLVAYVARALARLDAGEPVDPATLCRDHPRLAEAVAELLGMQSELPRLQLAALHEDPLQGALLAGRYRLADCLGRGAMGVVYGGTDQELQRPVAVKILDVRLFRDPEAERRFQREAEALASLQHPQVVAVFDRGRTPEGIHFLVMERLDGATLAALIERIEAGSSGSAAAAAITGDDGETGWPRRCARWARDLAHGLGAAHGHGLVHRDVKPSNVFLCRSGRIVLLDFGIAARHSDLRLTATRTTLGTPWYMPPEQVRAGGQSAVAAPTLDIYGLGATLYHLLAGRPPYEGDAATVLATLAHQAPPPLSQVQPGLPRDLVAIVERCLERDPLRRYPTAAALAADLDAFLQHLPVVARPIGLVGRRLRAWRLAPARPLAVAALLSTVLSGVFWWRSAAEQRARELTQQVAAIQATLPSVLAVEGWPDERILQPLQAEHRFGIELLDQLLTLAPDDLPARLFRACLRQDLGDAAGAAADFAILAGGSDGDYLPALAARYAAADPQRLGAKAIDLQGLPAPMTPAECYVAAFHELRQSDVPGFAARAEQLFTRALPQYPPARDGRLLALAGLAERASGADRTTVLRQLYDETVALEQLYGQATARTRAMRGVALLLRGDYRAAIPEFELSLQLRPGRHGPLQNLGVCWHRLHDYERAFDCLQQALAVRPFAWNTRSTLALVERDRGNFAAAYRWAEGLAKTGLRDEAWRQPDLLGSIAQAESAALRERDPAAARAAAARALMAYDEALSVRANAEARQRREVVVAMQKDRPQEHLLPFAQALFAAPDQPYQLANLAWLLPEQGLGPAETAWLAAIVRRLAALRAPGDEAFQQRMNDEIEKGLKPYR